MLDGEALAGVLDQHVPDEILGAVADLDVGEELVVYRADALGGSGVFVVWLVRVMCTGVRVVCNAVWIVQRPWGGTHSHATWMQDHDPPQACIR